MTLHEPDAPGTLSGSRVRLRPLLPDDHEWLYTTAVTSEAGHRWRLHGALPAPDQFFANVLGASSANLVIGRHDRPDRLGFIQIWNVDQLSRTGQLTVFLADEHVQLGWPMEALILAAGHAFSALDLRKLYLETLEPQLAPFESLIGWVLEREGVLRDHQYAMGELHDCHVLALYRDAYVQALDEWTTRTNR